MKIVELQTENFKRLRAVQIKPDGNVVVIAGNNGQGKSSILDAIWVALIGIAAAPPKPIRAGQEQAIIRLDLGEIIVTRGFREGKEPTLKVTNGEGLRYDKPQKVLDALLGEIGFDPFAFVQMKPDDQAATLRDMVPLSVDLDELAVADTNDREARTVLNRRIKEREGQLAAITEIPETEWPEVPDRDALLERMANASQTNEEIAAQERHRDHQRDHAARQRAWADDQDEKAATLRREADEAEQAAKEARAEAEAADAWLAEQPELAERVDAMAIREELTRAEQANRVVEAQKGRLKLAEETDELRTQSEMLTNALEDREAKRVKALEEAEMPIPGLGFALVNGKQRVTFGGVPFEQASTAEQLRASTAIAMEANPRLRVLRIKDGSLLDDSSLKMLSEMAEAEDFQLWIERVGTGDVGIIIEDGAVKQPDPPPGGDAPEQDKAAEEPKSKRKAAAKPEQGGLL